MIKTSTMKLVEKVSVSVRGYVHPLADIVELGSANVLCESSDFGKGGNQEYDFGDTGSWDF